MGFFRPMVEFAVGAEGECVLGAKDEYCNHTRSKSSLSFLCIPYFCNACTIFRVFLNICIVLRHGNLALIRVFLIFI